MSKGDVNMTEFGKRLKVLIETKKVSAAQLSRMTGISEATISRYLSGQYEAKQGNIFKISQALLVSPDYLLGSEDNIEIHYGEKELMYIYNALSLSGKDKVLEYAGMLLDKERKDVQG